VCTCKRTVGSNPTPSASPHAKTPDIPKRCDNRSGTHVNACIHALSNRRCRQKSPIATPRAEGIIREVRAVSYGKAALPHRPGLPSPDMTVPEVMAFRHESAATVFRKIRNGNYRSHKNGDTRLIELASVIADRDACIARGPQLAPLRGKRGRPKKIAAPAAVGGCRP
jgi:hypothetical protein